MNEQMLKDLSGCLSLDGTIVFDMECASFIRQHGLRIEALLRGVASGDAPTSQPTAAPEANSYENLCNRLYAYDLRDM